MWISLKIETTHGPSFEAADATKHQMQNVLVSSTDLYMQTYCIFTSACFASKIIRQSTRRPSLADPVAHTGFRHTMPKCAERQHFKNIYLSNCRRRRRLNRSFPKLSYVCVCLVAFARANKTQKVFGKFKSTLFFLCESVRCDVDVPFVVDWKIIHANFLLSQLNK